MDEMGAVVHTNPMRQVPPTSDSEYGLPPLLFHPNTGTDESSFHYSGLQEELRENVTGGVVGDKVEDTPH